MFDSLYHIRITLHHIFIVKTLEFCDVHNVMESYRPQHKKTCLQGLANNKGTDCSAPWLFIFWESIVSKLATGEISIF